jgi:hypothetical protein
MLKRSMAGIALGFLAMMLAGCAVVQKGETVVKYDKGELPIMGEAPTEGQYSLYRVTDATPLVTYPLKAGDKLGYKRTDQGSLLGVAGSHEVPLTNDSYYWKRR